MSDVVTEGWLDPWMGRGRSPGGSGVVAVIVTGLPDGQSIWQARLEDGVVVAVEAGAPGTTDLTLTVSLAIAEAIASGSLTPSAAFMQGRMKTAGDQGLVLDVLAAVDGSS
jgi:alkyl sulfatase BDS1-like metallo-beta-lactamase superfamily hydrolase